MESNTRIKLYTRLEKRMTYEQIRKIVSQISYGDWNFIVGEDETRFFLQVLFDRPCVKAGVVQRQTCRKWRLTIHMTKSEIVQTALKAVLSAEEHEARERFQYRNESIFAPHFDVDALHDFCRNAPKDQRI
jgi:hypothetical protein